MAREVVRRRCAKCNITTADDKNLIFHRFPLPGKHGMSRTRAWAIYCYPDGDWSTENSLKNLHFQHKMICSKHFDQSCYTTSSKKRLNIFAIPNDSDDLLKLHIEQNLSKTRHDTDTSVEKPQLESNTELLKGNTIPIERSTSDSDSSTLKQEGEMDISETSIASTSLNMDTVIMEPRRKVITAKQTSILCNFFEDNPEVIRGYKRTPKCMDKVQVKWKNITPHLNAVGPPRDHRAWSKYLSDMKGKLKRKSIKWKQSCDGKDPIMYNTDDFDEIKLRMLQVLRTDVSNMQESQDSHSSDLETEAANNYHNNHIEGENEEIATLREDMPDVKPKLEYLEQNNLNNVLVDHNVRTPSPVLQQRPKESAVADEFDYFGQNVAEQLRNLPLLVALETQEMLLSVLKIQRLKVLNGSDPLINNI